jgi:hypothetical protein
MNDKIDTYVDGVFAPYEGAKSVSELKADLLADLHERFRELKAEGKDDTPISRAARSRAAMWRTPTSTAPT